MRKPFKRRLSGLILLSLAIGCYFHMAPTSSGIYAGILPTASGPGREVVLYLYPDGNCFQKTMYFQTPANPIVETGFWNENKKVISVRFSDNRESFFRVKRDRLIVLDNDRKELAVSHPYTVLVRTGAF